MPPWWAVAACVALPLCAAQTYSLAVVVVATPDVVDQYQAAINSKQCYCLLHGYTLVLDTNMYDLGRAPHWNKLVAVSAALPLYDWVVSMDADVVVTNSSVPLTHFLPVKGVADTPDMWFADGTELNTGVFFARDSPWTREFLEVWWSALPTGFMAGPVYAWVFEQAGALEASLLHAAQESTTGMPYFRGTCLAPGLDTYMKVNACWRRTMARLGFPHGSRSTTKLGFLCGEGRPGRGFNQKNGISQPVYARLYRPHEVWRPGDFVAHVITARDKPGVLERYAPASMFLHDRGSCPWQVEDSPTDVHWVTAVPLFDAHCAASPPCLEGLWEGSSYVHFSPWVGYNDELPWGSRAPAPHIFRITFAQYQDRELGNRPASLEDTSGADLVDFRFRPDDDVWSRHTDFCMRHAMNCEVGWANFQASQNLMSVDASVGLDGPEYPAGVWALEALADEEPEVEGNVPLNIVSPRHNDTITCCCCRLDIRIELDWGLLATPSLRRHLLETTAGTVPRVPPGIPTGPLPYHDTTRNVHGRVCLNVSRLDGADAAPYVENLCLDVGGRDLLAVTLPESAWVPSRLLVYVWWEATPSVDVSMLTMAWAWVNLAPSNPASVEMLWSPFEAGASLGPQPGDHPLPVPPPVSASTNVSAWVTQQDAYVTLVWSDEYVAGVVVLARSLSAVGSRQPLVVLVGYQDDGVSPMLSADAMATLEAMPTVEIVGCTALADTEPASRMPRLGVGLWMKLRVWQLTQYRCVTFLDADSMVLRNIDHLFLLCDEGGVAALTFDGRPLLDGARRPSKWTNFVFASVPTTASEYRNAHTITGFFVTKPSAAVFDTLLARLHANPRYCYGESAFVDAAFAEVKVVLPHAYMCIAEGMDEFYADGGQSCAVVDFQSCGVQAWKPWDAGGPPDTADTVCRFLPSPGYLGAVAAWREVWRG